MSIVLYRKCDHCGKELDEIKDYIEVELDKYGLVVADLCASCYEEFNTWLKKWISRGEGEE